MTSGQGLRIHVSMSVRGTRIALSQCARPMREAARPTLLAATAAPRSTRPRPLAAVRPLRPFVGLAISWGPASPVLQPRSTAWIARRSLPPNHHYRLTPLIFRRQLRLVAGKFQYDRTEFSCGGKVQRRQSMAIFRVPIPSNPPKDSRLRGALPLADIRQHHSVHQTSEPEPLRAVLARISDDSHGAGNQQPAQMSIALLRDPAKSLLASDRMLSRHQPDPRSQTAAQRELLPISHLSHQRGGDDRADTGDSSSRRLSSHERSQAWIRFSMVTISAPTAAYWRARTSRLNRAAAGMRSSCSSATISSSSAVPLRPFADMMPSSAKCPRIAFDSIVR
jgi:hypothetical protein